MHNRKDPVERTPNIEAHASAFQFAGSPSITISDDQSVHEKVRERNLLALRGDQSDSAPQPSSSKNRNNQASSKDKDKQSSSKNKDKQSSSKDRNKQSSYKDTDYKLQLQLLEQQNKRRLMLARAEQSASSSSGVRMTGDRKRQRKNSDDEQGDEVVENMDVGELKSYIKRLEKRAADMGTTSSEVKHFRHQILYRIGRSNLLSEMDSEIEWDDSRSYFDQPSFVAGENNSGILKSTLPVNNLDLYLEKNKEVCSIVYHTYIQPSSHGSEATRRQSRTKSYNSRITTSIRPISQKLKAAVSTALKNSSGCHGILQEFLSTGELTAPYIFFRHFRDKFEQVAKSCDLLVESQLRLLMDHIIEVDGDVLEAAEVMIAQGNISPRLMPYLIKPGDLIVCLQDDQYSGWIAKKWASEEGASRENRSKANEMVMGARNQVLNLVNNFAKPGTDEVMVRKWSISAWQWQFNGAFNRQTKTLNWCIQQEITDYEQEKKGGQLPAEMSQPIQIQDMKMMPLRYCPAKLVDQLRQRGQTVWKCRKRCFVGYSNSDTDFLNADDRYMVDLKTYRELHPANPFENYLSDFKPEDELSEEAMRQDSCPGEDFDLLLPPKIKGYHLQRKKWYDLFVDRISDVIWNKETFSKIVMDPKAKEIVRALISKQLASERSTDLITGKGNGLILLLHGGPGTGKTLTAESVAEIAEKPLYRVTCGDVGIKAEAVEKYLQSVFHLGKRWGCVVLLDEADVFLEQRNLQDLERNALVSVFLRTLEYYEGILILTSNRVGTFDEAFKSRIQLALYYPTLTESQRLRIWENFIDRLDSFNDGTVNITDLKYHLEDLAKQEMNGREIRNVITTARQYAEYMGTVLTYNQLNDVMQLSARFDTYLSELNGGWTHDEMAKDDGIR